MNDICLNVFFLLWFGLVFNRNTSRIENLRNGTLMHLDNICFSFLHSSNINVLLRLGRNDDDDGCIVISCFFSRFLLYLVQTNDDIVVIILLQPWWCTRCNFKMLSYLKKDITDVLWLHCVSYNAPPYG